MNPPDDFFTRNQVSVGLLFQEAGVQYDYKAEYLPQVVQFRRGDGHKRLDSSEWEVETECYRIDPTLLRDKTAEGRVLSAIEVLGDLGCKTARDAYLAAGGASVREAKRLEAENAARQFIADLVANGIEYKIHVLKHANGKTLPIMATDVEHARLLAEVADSRLIDMELVEARDLDASYLVQVFDKRFFDDWHRKFEDHTRSTAVVTTSTVEDLLKAVDLEVSPVKETVHFGHGGGHKKLIEPGHFYVDLSELESVGKEERMREALGILAQRLGSQEAKKTLLDCKVLAHYRDDLRWDEPTYDLGHLKTLIEQHGLKGYEFRTEPWREGLSEGTEFVVAPSKSAAESFIRRHFERAGETWRSPELVGVLELPGDRDLPEWFNDFLETFDLTPEQAIETFKEHSTTRNVGR